MRALKKVAASMMLVIGGAPSEAAIVSVSGGVPLAGQGLVTTRTLGITEERFDAPGCGLQTDVTLLVVEGTAVDYTLGSGSIPNRRLAPVGDSSCYF